MQDYVEDSIEKLEVSHARDLVWSAGGILMWVLNLKNSNDPNWEIFIDVFHRFSEKWLKWYSVMTSRGAYMNGMCECFLYLFFF